MIRGVFVAAVCAGLVWTAPATGAFMDGDRLLAKCNEDPGEGLAVCVGYVAGIADVLLMDSVRGRRACMSLSVMTEQMVDAVRRWLEAHPDDRRYAANGLVAEALSTAFPCK